MIKEEDVILSKMSYTDKDFASIYPDLLDLAKQLTDKWDPSLSNESDPGVVLLKEGAFIADHGNYNIDKNVLENFLPSATQESSVRNILDLNGYIPEYYVSAEGEITFTYKPEETIENFPGVTIKKFTIVVTNQDNNIFYTQVSDLAITTQGLAATATFIEGLKQSLEINGSNVILLDNLDDNNRLYFPVKYVASNGIFIRNYVTSAQDNGDYWEKKDYISTQPLNSKIYKVGFDSALGVPYVEFPSDIANIIGSGLIIDYISSTGINGNVKANTLTQISSPTTFDVSDELSLEASDFNLTNSYSIMNGKNPETIDEMYKSFKKVVGTFDTLVTCQDYSNAVYNAKNGVNRYVSNAVVTDRNNDYNNAFKIISYDEYGEYFELASKLMGYAGFRLNTTKPEIADTQDIIFENGQFKRYAGLDELLQQIWVPVTELSYNDFINTTAAVAMTPFDLCLYALKAYSLSDYIDSLPYRAIEKSFEPITDETFNDITDEDVGPLKDYKCINHSFLSAQDGDVICFKNYVPLNITITPYSKVTKQEKEEIINSIYKALTDNFNAEKLDFGDELNYDEVLEVLLNSDDRIKNIRLEDFEYVPKAMVKDSTVTSGYQEVNLYDEDTEGADILLDVIAKNVLAGRVCLFNFDDTFTYKYGQVSEVIYNDIATIRTEVEINAEEDSSVSQSSTSETSIDYQYMYNELITKICITGNDETASGKISIPSQGSYEFKDTEILYVDIKGVVKEYETAGEHTLTLHNYTGATINIEYVGTERTNWVNLSDGKITLVIKTEQINNKNYDLVYKPKENEYIEIAYNNYTTDAIFPTYIKYRFTATGADEEYYIPADTDHILQPNETLTLIFTENGSQSSKQYTTGDVIRANFDMKPTDYVTIAGTTKKVGDLASASYTTLGASQQIEHRQLMETHLTDANTPCYWIVNNNSNTLFYNAEGGQTRTDSKILSSGEYFVYSNANKDSMIILGPGSLLTRSSNDTSKWSTNTKITLKEIQANGFNAEIEWQTKDFSGDKTFKFQEMNIITLCNGDELMISNWVGQDKKITTEWAQCTGDIAYSLSDGEYVELSELPTGETYHIRSRLDIMLNSTDGQKLQDGQKFIITCEDTGVEEITIQGSDVDPVYLQSSVELNLYGDNKINISEYTSGSSKLNFMKYTTVEPKITTQPYSPIYSGLIELTGEYYQIISNNYVRVTQEYIQQLHSMVPPITSFEELYEAFPDTLWYTKDSETVTKALVPANNKYTVNIKEPAIITMPFHYSCIFSTLSDDHKEYILPVFLNYGGAQITARIRNTGASYITPKIKDYNFSSPQASITLDNTEMYLLTVCIDNSESSEGLTVDTNLELILECNGVPNEPQVLNIYEPVIVNGINEGFGNSFTLGDIIDQMDTIIANSTNPNVKPYYIYRPEDSIAIQDPDFENPLVFWDKNNIISHLTIAQIDIRTMADAKYPTIDIIKSMRNY